MNEEDMMVRGLGWGMIAFFVYAGLLVGVLAAVTLWILT